MAEPEQQVSSTEPLIQLDSHHYEPEPDPEPEPEPAPVPGPVPDLFSLDDIVDLVGGAQDALQRHMAADSAELEPEPGPEPGPDSTTGSGARTEPGTEPGTGPGTPPGPGTGPGAERPAPGPRAAAFAPAEDSLQDLSAATLRPAAPVPDEPSPSKAQPPVLMQFPTELGQGAPPGAPPAPVSPLSPLHSPDSLEELSLTESPNQAPPPPPGGPALSQPPPGPGRPQTRDQDLLDSLAGPYLSLGKDPGPPHNNEDSGVSVSPEDKLGPSPVRAGPTEPWESPFPAPRGPLDPRGPPAPPQNQDKDQDQDLSDEEDLMSEVKRNPFEFQGSESPTPDLVQYGTTAGPQEGVPPALEPEPLSKAAAPTAFKDEEDEEDAVLPPSLPDILKSSPLNPDKLDSGSSEGSPEQSPVFERRMMESPNPPINLSANNPFAFEAKVSLLKEMTEQMEAERDSDQVRVQDQDQNLGTFDLVKEAEPPAPAVPVRVEQQDWFSGRGDAPPPHRAAPEPFEPLDFLEKKKNPTVVEDSDSESPTADSLSPVLEAMAKNPASFQVEAELKGAELKQEEAEPEEEVSEHEVSSEEFEFIERPPRGVIDDFLEALDTSKFAAAAPPEIPLDDDELGFEAKETTPTKELATPPKDLATPPKEAEPEEDWASYRLLTQAPPPQKSKAELETPEATPPASKVAPPTTSQVATPPTLAGQSEQPTAPTSSRKGFTMPNMNLRKVVELLYWRDVKTTGVVFGAALLLLLSLTLCSIVSVCSYVGLALLSVTICFRIYKGILQAVQKSDEGHPFRQYLDQEVALSEDTVHKYSDLVLAKLNKTICEMRRLFLVEDLVDSIKFAVLMWILTYIGALFNGLTLLILGLVAVFSCPIVYEKHQTQIDHYVGMVNNQVKDVIGKIQAKVPGMKRKAE